MHSQARAFIYELHSQARAINTVIDTLCVQLPYIINHVEGLLQFNNWILLHTYLVNNTVTNLISAQ